VTRNLLARYILLLCVMLGSTSAAHAQCRIGSGPDFHDGVPYCSEIAPPPPVSGPRPPRRPAQWNDQAAAVAWGDTETSDDFVGVSKYEDEWIAREIVLDKCRERGLTDCVVAKTITNGVILVARDSNGRLRLRTDANEKEARVNLAQKCKEAGTTCKVLAVFDGRPEWF
jgi:hypothetical protein